MCYFKYQNFEKLFNFFLELGRNILNKTFLLLFSPQKNILQILCAQNFILSTTIQTDERFEQRHGAEAGAEWGAGEGEDRGADGSQQAGGCRPDNRAGVQRSAQTSRQLQAHSGRLVPFQCSFLQICSCKTFFYLICTLGVLILDYSWS